MEVLLLISQKARLCMTVTWTKPFCQYTGSGFALTGCRTCLLLNAVLGFFVGFWLVGLWFFGGCCLHFLLKHVNEVWKLILLLPKLWEKKKKIHCEKLFYSLQRGYEKVTKRSWWDRCTNNSLMILQSRKPVKGNAYQREFLASRSKQVWSWSPQNQEKVSNTIHLTCKGPMNHWLTSHCSPCSSRTFHSFWVNEKLLTNWKLLHLQHNLT